MRRLGDVLLEAALVAIVSGLFIQAQPAKPDPCRHGTLGLAYADGHAKFATPFKWRSLQQRYRLPLPPVMPNLQR